MSDVAAAIMDAAERRMRKGGFSGFSFREIAADVGVKSSSVHYHFPTKENPAAAVIQRYTAQTADLIERELQKEPNEKLVEEGLSSDEASQLLATITGALVVANAVNDLATYDRATREVTRAWKPAPAKVGRQRSK